MRWEDLKEYTWLTELGQIALAGGIASWQFKLVCSELERAGFTHSSMGLYDSKKMISNQNYEVVNSGPGMVLTKGDAVVALLRRTKSIGIWDGQSIDESSLKKHLTGRIVETIERHRADFANTPHAASSLPVVTP